MAPTDEVTVVIPTKDRRALLHAAVASVLAQVDVDVRVVVVDDGSAVPAASHLPDDPRVQVVRNETSLGVSGARNRGLELVTTPWVAFLDDDDVWSEGKLRRQLDALHASGYRWACSASVNFSDDEVLGLTNEPAVDDVAALMLTGNHIPAGGSGVLADTRLVRQVGGFDTSLASLADWDCWLRLAQESPVARVGQTDVGYRINAGGMAHDVPRQEAELRRMVAKYSALASPLLLQPAPPYRAYLARME